MWEIKSLGYHEEQIIGNGNKFLIGSMNLGVRGTLDEHEKDDLVAVNLPLLYDQVGDSWREPINAFNPLYTVLKVDDEIISLKHKKPIYHEQSLNMLDATMYRKTIFKIGSNEITIESTRFVSSNHDRLIVGNYKVSFKEQADFKIYTGIDYDVWDINGPHLIDIKTNHDLNRLEVSGKSYEKSNLIKVVKKVIPNFKVKVQHTLHMDGKILYEILPLKTNSLSYAFDFFAHISIDDKNDLSKEVFDHTVALGFDKLLEDHLTCFHKKWEDSDVKIEGDDEALIALRYSIYHLIILSPDKQKGQSVPARGISGQTYKGAIFWDTEIFMLPFYLNTNLKAAKNIILYRIKGLNGAKLKASYYGYKGAFFAWESQEDGHDACTDYNVTDVFTNRLIRTYFKDKQVHISADIIYALKSYILRTKDDSILYEGGLELLIEVARFYLDYGSYKVLKDRFEILDVMGPDEYHERVHNNAFTNRMVQMVFDYLFEIKDFFTKIKSDYFNTLVHTLGFDAELELIHHMRQKIYIPKPNKDLIIEQFDGYFLLKDIDIKTRLNEKIHPNEYLGGQGLLGDTQNIKQADILTMLYLFRSDYNKDIIKANFNYYEPRTEHGSSLSASMYALGACMMENEAYAYPLFMKSASVDLTGDSKQYAGGIYIGGTHPAASGGAYLTAIYGFSGLNIDDEIHLKPALPKSIQKMTYRIKHLGKTYEIMVTKNDYTIKEIL